MGKELDSDLRTRETLGGSVWAAKPRTPLSDAIYGVCRGGLRERLEQEPKGERKRLHRSGMEEGDPGLWSGVRYGRASQRHEP